MKNIIHYNEYRTPIRVRVVNSTTNVVVALFVGLIFDIIAYNLMLSIAGSGDIELKAFIFIGAQIQSALVAFTTLVFRTTP